MFRDRFVDIVIFCLRRVVRVPNARLLGRNANLDVERWSARFRRTRLELLGVMRMCRGMLVEVVRVCLRSSVRVPHGRPSDRNATLDVDRWSARFRRTRSYFICALDMFRGMLVEFATVCLRSAARVRNGRLPGRNANPDVEKCGLRAVGARGSHSYARCAWLAACFSRSLLSVSVAPSALRSRLPGQNANPVVDRWSARFRCTHNTNCVQLI